MRKGSSWLAAALGTGLAAGGAVAAGLAADGPWALAGAAAGAVTGSFAPTVYDAIRRRDADRNAFQGMTEGAVPPSPARLLDPRLALVGFVGRHGELAILELKAAVATADRHPAAPSS
jgi:hypothetical protein